MHEDTLSRAASPARSTIMGLPLKSYSLGHELMLIRNSNPLAFADKCKPYDLTEAVWLCSNSWRQNQGGRLDRLKLKLWGIRARKFLKLDFGRDLAAFLDYRDSGSLQFPASNTPRPDEGHRTTRIFGAPLLLKIHQFLVLHYRLTPEQAWDHENGLARCYYATWLEEHDRFDIYNFHDWDHDEEVRKLDEEEGGKK